MTDLSAPRYDHTGEGVLVAAVLLLAFGSLPGEARNVGLQHVTLIGDSVADCPIGGVRPPNVIQLVSSTGSKLGPNLVVAVGYNDLEDQYATNIETALNAFKAAGVRVKDFTGPSATRRLTLRVRL